MDPRYFLKSPERDPDYLARRTVRAPFIILVEGQDDLWFLDELLHSLALSPTLIQTMDYGGSGELPRYLENLLREDIVLDGEVRGVLVTGDADTYVGQLPYKVNRAVKAAGFSDLKDRALQNVAGATPGRMGLFLIPESGTLGALETLLLRTVKEEASVKDARALVEKHYNETAPKNDKHVTQAYLSTKPKLSRGAGFGTRIGYFNIEDAALNDLKTTIKSLVA